MGFRTIKTIPHNIFADKVLTKEQAMLCLSILEKEFIFQYDEKDLIFANGEYRTPIANKTLKDIDFYLLYYAHPKDRVVKKFKILLRGKELTIPLCSS